MHRLGRLHHLGQAAVVDRHRAPAEELQALLADDAHPHALAVRAQALVLRHEEVADGVVAGLGQLDARASRIPRARNACGIWMRMPAPSPASGSAPTAPRCSRFSRMASASLTSWCDLRALQVGDEADAAGVVLAARVEQAARPRASSCSFRMPARSGSASSSNVMASRLSALAFLPRGRSGLRAHRAPSPRTPKRAAETSPVSRGAERRRSMVPARRRCAAAAPPCLPDRTRGCTAASGGAVPCGRSPQFASAHATR